LPSLESCESRFHISGNITKGSKPVKYLMMIYMDERAFYALSDTERQKVYDECGTVRERLIAQGKFLGGSRLQPTTAARSIRLRDGKELVTDGPFAETHEQLGGYALLDVDNFDEALAIARQSPLLKIGTLELRPLVEQAAEASA
jgi:hypothetical protein